MASCKDCLSCKISIHTLRVEGDLRAEFDCILNNLTISIHTLRVEGDEILRLKTEK